MQKIKIALCDKDKFYCERFAAYMMNHKAQEIELNIYSTIEQFTGDEKMGNFDLVIAGSGFEEFSSDVNIMYLSDLCGNHGGGGNVGKRYDTAEENCYEISADGTVAA